MKILRLLGSFTESIKCDCDEGWRTVLSYVEKLTSTSQLESAQNNFNTHAIGIIRLFPLVKILSINTPKNRWLAA